MKAEAGAEAGGRRWWGFALSLTPQQTARVFHRLLAAIYFLAWLSLYWQIDLLIGSNGLLPITDLANLDGGASFDRFLRFPTIFLWAPNDTALHVGLWLGFAVSLLWLAGFASQACAIVSAFLYLSYATVARDFLHFQWDNMIIECGVLAAFLPRHRPARWIHFLFHVLLFKLYFESGIAKWQSYLGDWHDGSAMTFYYETAPIPTALAWYFHHLPAWWHHLESWSVLGLELVLPFAIFAGHRSRLAACVLFTGFQLINIATANYGFFCYLSLALHVFLLTDRNVDPPNAYRTPRLRPARAVAAAVAAVLYCSVSAIEAAYSFTSAPANATINKARRIYRPWRAVNTYHLFGHITRERIEPEFQTFDGAEWTTHDLRYKPGHPNRPPPLVAPHQPRVDFRLWFYGLSYQRGTPRYVRSIVERICAGDGALGDLFVEPMSNAPAATRLVFWRYSFSPAGKQNWWTRSQVGATRAVDCNRSPTK